MSHIVRLHTSVLLYFLAGSGRSYDAPLFQIAARQFHQLACVGAGADLHDGDLHDLPCVPVRVAGRVGDERDAGRHGSGRLHRRLRGVPARRFVSLRPRRREARVQCGDPARRCIRHSVCAVRDLLRNRCPLHLTCWPGAGRHLHAGHHARVGQHASGAHCIGCRMDPCRHVGRIRDFHFPVDGAADPLRL